MNLFALLAAVVAAVPVYGYFVHAARDSQQVGLLIILSWLLTCAFLTLSLIALIVRHRRGQEATRTGFLAAYFLVVGIIGSGGVHKAFFELIAG